MQIFNYAYYTYSGLTSFDSILLITSVLLFVQPTICTFVGIGEYYFKHVHPIITPYIYLLAMTSQTSSVYLTVTVTVERYIAVCHPLRARSWCTCGRGRIAIVIIGLLSMLYNVPRFLEVDHCVYYDKQSNESWVVVNNCFSHSILPACSFVRRNLVTILWRCLDLKIDLWWTRPPLHYD